MSALVIFDDSTLFEGFTITYTLKEDMSKTILLSECFRRLQSVLESLNLKKLLTTLKDESFVIKESIDEIKEGDTIRISCLQ